MIKKILDGLDPEKARLLDIQATVVYQGKEERVMFTLKPRTLSDLIHACSALKHLAAGLEKTIQDGKYTPEEFQDMENTPIRATADLYLGIKPFAQA